MALDDRDYYWKDRIRRAKTYNPDDPASWCSDPDEPKLKWNNKTDSAEVNERHIGKNIRKPKQATSSEWKKFQNEQKQGKKSPETWRKNALAPTTRANKKNKGSNHRASDSPLWSQIAMGIVVGAAVLFFFNKAYERYQIFQINQAFQQANEQLKQRTQASMRKLQERQIQSDTQRQLLIAQDKRQNIQNALNNATATKRQSDQCRFWTDNKNITGASERINEYCTLSSAETAFIVQRYQ